MKRHIELILQHGWAYDREIWARVAELAVIDLGKSVDVQAFDRGYFCAPNEVSWRRGKCEAQSLRAVICHSFGLHLLPRDIAQSADVLVIAGGFLAIHGDDRTRARRSRATLARMLKGLALTPHQTLFDFHKLCSASRSPDRVSWCASEIPAETLLEGSPDQPSPDSSQNSSLASSQDLASELDLELLAADLRSMDESLFDPCMINPATKVVIVHGHKDPVVPFERAEQLHAALVNSSLVCIEDGGHSLPLTHPHQCLSPVLDRLLERIDRRGRAGVSITSWVRGRAGVSITSWVRGRPARSRCGQDARALRQPGTANEDGLALSEESISVGADAQPAGKVHGQFEVTGGA